MPSVDFFATAPAPRTEARIGDLILAPIGLAVEWPRIEDKTEADFAGVRFPVKWDDGFGDLADKTVLALLLIIEGLNFFCICSEYKQRCPIHPTHLDIDSPDWQVIITHSNGPWFCLKCPQIENQKCAILSTKI